jgi:hypothetical protein
MAVDAPVFWDGCTVTLLVLVYTVLMDMFVFMASANTVLVDVMLLRVC